MDCYATGTGPFETRYAEQGAGHPVLWLHGWGASLRLWREVWPLAVPRFRSIAPDLPGWGGSDKPDAPYTPEWYAEWIGTFLDARFAPSASVVAHSMGAMAAATFAARHPERVRRLVLVNPPVDGATAFAGRTATLSKPVLSHLMYAMWGCRRLRRRIARDFTWMRPWDEEDIDGMARATYASLVRPIRGMLATDLRPMLASLRMPVLVVSTPYDRVVKPEQAELARKMLAAARRLQVEECGHCPMWERPEEFARPVLDFLAEGLPSFRPPQW